MKFTNLLMMEEALLNIKRFLDIPKAFDKVWHQKIILKVRQNGISCDLLNILSDFLTNRKQRVVLNGQTCSWANITAGVPKESILGPVLFLIYVNDLPDCLIFIVKLLSDGTSLFSVVHDISVSAKERNEDFNFNPDPSKQAQQLLFRRKLQKVSHPKLFCNNADVSKTNSQKHFGLIIDSKLTFPDHLDTVFIKVRKTIGFYAS